MDDWRTDTAEVPRMRASRPDVTPPPPPPPSAPPAAVEPPGPARWPLYADEQAPAAEPEPAPVPASWSYAAPSTPVDDQVEAGWFAYAAAPDDLDDRRSPVLWVLITSLVVLILIAGWWFLARAS